MNQRLIKNHQDDSQINCRIFYKKYKNLHLGHFSLLFHANQIGCYLYLPANIDSNLSNRIKLQFELSYLGLDRIHPIWLVDLLPRDHLDKSFEQQVSMTDLILHVDSALVHKKTLDYHNDVYKKIKPIIHHGLCISNYVYSHKINETCKQDAFELAEPDHPTVLGLYRRGITADHLHEFISWSGQTKSIVQLFEVAYFMSKSLPTVVGIVNPIKINIVNWPSGTVEFSDYYQPLSQHVYLSADKVKENKIIYLRGIRTLYLVYDCTSKTATMHRLSKPLSCKDSLTWLSGKPYQATFILMPLEYSHTKKSNVIKNGLIAENGIKSFKIPDIGVFTKDCGKIATYIQTTRGNRY